MDTEGRIRIIICTRDGGMSRKENIMKNKEVSVKVSLSEDELNSISGGSVVTKEVSVDGINALISFGNNLVSPVSADVKNEPGDNSVFKNKNPGTIL